MAQILKRRSAKGTPVDRGEMKGKTVGPIRCDPSVESGQQRNAN
jgi:hypothetical protein